MTKMLKKILLLVAKQYTSIGGQAVIEGVMMRSPNAFVVAVRKPDGTIRLRRDQWFGFSKRFDFLKKPFFRGVIMLIETMANGIVSLNYSANIAMNEELKEEALKKGKTLEEFEAEQKKKEKVDWATFFTMAASFAFGIGLFVFVPHAATAFIDQTFQLQWNLDGFAFHFVDGLIKAMIFISYIFIIGFIPDIRRVFQYHGAEHKSISTFEAGEELTIENAKKFTTLHPRCGTSFIFFLLFISIIIFSVLFTLIPVGQGLPTILRHVVAVVVKVAFMIPVAGISYEIIKFAGKHLDNIFCKALSVPGMMLQKLTTKEPDEEQLEVALSSIKAVLQLEEKYNLKEAKEKILTLEEVDIKELSDIENTNQGLKDFLE
jgi:uncharacterized protein YqhQ